MFSWKTCQEFSQTFTRSAISRKSLFTSTSKRTVSVATVGVFITWTWIRRALIEILRETNQGLNKMTYHCRHSVTITNEGLHQENLFTCKEKIKVQNREKDKVLVWM